MNAALKLEQYMNAFNIPETRKKMEESFLYEQEKTEFGPIELNNYIIDIMSNRKDTKLNIKDIIDSSREFTSNQSKTDFLYNSLNLHKKDFLVVPSIYFVEGYNNDQSQLIVSSHDLISKCHYMGGKSEENKSLLQKLFLGNNYTKKLINPKEMVFDFLRKYNSKTIGNRIHYQSRLGERYKSDDFEKDLILVPCTYKK